MKEKLMNHDNPYNIWNRWLETYVEDLKDTGGGKVSGRCPSPDHPDLRPSFSASRDEYWYNCFSCGVKGNAVQFAKMLNLDYNIFNGFDFALGTYTAVNTNNHTNTDRVVPKTKKKKAGTPPNFHIEFKHVRGNMGMIRPVCYSCKKILKTHEEGVFIWTPEKENATILVHKGDCDRRVVLVDQDGEPIVDESIDGKKSYRNLEYSWETRGIFKTYRKGRGKWKNQTVDFY
jgi:hypothetical protein